MSRIFDALQDELRPRRHAHVDEIVEAAVGVGLDRIGSGLAPTVWRRSPDGLAQSLEERLFAPLWDLPPDEWAASVEPAISALHALPDPDRERSRRIDHPFVVMAKP